MLSRTDRCGILHSAIQLLVLLFLSDYNVFPRLTAVLAVLGSRILMQHQILFEFLGLGIHTRGIPNVLDLLCPLWYVHPQGFLALSLLVYEC